MSELFPTPVATLEPDWLKEARRRDKQTSDFTSLTATDRRALLKAYDTQELELMQLRGQLRDAHQTIKDLSRDAAH